MITLTSTSNEVIRKALSERVRNLENTYINRKGMMRRDTNYIQTQAMLNMFNREDNEIQIKVKYVA